MINEPFLYHCVDKAGLLICINSVLVFQIFKNNKENKNVCIHYTHVDVPD